MQLLELEKIADKEANLLVTILTDIQRKSPPLEGEQLTQELDRRLRQFRTENAQNYSLDHATS